MKKLRFLKGGHDIKKEIMFNDFSFEKTSTYYTVL